MRNLSRRGANEQARRAAQRTKTHEKRKAKSRLAHIQTLLEGHYARDLLKAAQQKGVKPEQSIPLLNLIKRAAIWVR